LNSRDENEVFVYPLDNNAFKGIKGLTDYISPIVTTKLMMEKPVIVQQNELNDLLCKVSALQDPPFSGAFLILYLIDLIWSCSRPCKSKMTKKGVS
jgi:hypothetical protein